MPIKGWKNAASDLTKMRKQNSEDAKEYSTHRLKKNGELSGMHDARQKHASLEDAKAHIKRIQDLNPGKNVRYKIFHGANEVNEEALPSNVQEAVDDLLDSGYSIDDIFSALKDPKLLDEGKVRLKPGMTKSQYAIAKSKALEPKTIKQKAAEVDDDADSGKQLSNMLKGKYPWGTMSQATANRAITKLRTVDPRHRAGAIAAIWKDEAAFHRFIKEGKV